MSLSHPLDWELLWAGAPDTAWLRIGTTKCSGWMIDEVGRLQRERTLSKVTQEVGRTTKARNRVSWPHSGFWFWCVTESGVAQKDALDVPFSYRRAFVCLASKDEKSPKSVLLCNLFTSY